VVVPQVSLITYKERKEKKRNSQPFKSTHSKHTHTHTPLSKKGNNNSADVKAAFTECVGTGLLTAVIGMMASTLAGLTGGVQAAGAGAALFVLLLAGAKSSGAHYNPIVTTALVLLGKMSFGKGLMYVISQVIGGLAGGFLAKGLTGGMLGDPSFTLSGASFFTEVFFSFTLILTVLQSAVAKSQQGKNVFAPAIATVVGLGAALGASMNPAVSWGLFSAAGKDKGEFFFGACVFFLTQ
jgi:glycerol uptake facilitator-like aquaporin